jgi:hypothetical protein
VDKGQLPATGCSPADGPVHRHRVDKALLLALRLVACGEEGIDGAQALAGREEPTCERGNEGTKKEKEIFQMDALDSAWNIGEDTASIKINASVPAPCIKTHMSCLPYRRWATSKSPTYSRAPTSRRKMMPQMLKAQPSGVSGVENLALTWALVGPNQPRLEPTFTGRNTRRGKRHRGAQV